MEAMVIEAFTTARAYGVEDAVIASLVETFPGVDWEKQVPTSSSASSSTAAGAEEVREVAETVREAKARTWSAAGTALRQAWVADQADAGCSARAARRVRAEQRLAHRGRPHPRADSIKGGRKAA